LPRELVNSLIKNGESIYCEKCGIENGKEDFLSPQIVKTVKIENKKILWDILSTAKKKSLEYKKKIKTKLEELMEKSKNE